MPRPGISLGFEEVYRVVFALVVLGCAPRPSLDLWYQEGNDPQQTLDIYPVAGAELAPTVVWVHGGAWSEGDKSEDVSDKVRLFRSLGWVMVSVNYRLSPLPHELDNPNRLQHPAHVDDVRAALTWLSERLPDYGGDPDRVALLGSSAGAHLVTLVTADDQRRPAAGDCVVALEGIGYDISASI